MKRQRLARWQSCSLVFLIAVGILLRLMRIDRSYWFDELYTMAQLAEPSFRQLLFDTTQDANNPPLFSIASYGWVQLFGYSEIGTRSFSLFLGLLLLGTPWLARSALEPTEKWLACTLLALWYLPVRFAQEIRVYSLMTLLAAMCLFAYLELNVAPRRSTRITFHASLIVLALCHVFGVILAGCFIAVMIFYAPGIRQRMLLFLYGLVLTAAGATPMVMEGILSGLGGRFWIPFTPAWLLTQTVLIVTPVGGGLLLYGFGVFRAQPTAVLPAALRRALLPFLLLLIASIVLSLDTPVIIARNLIALVPALALICAVWLKTALVGRTGAIAIGLLGLMAVQSAMMEFFWISFSREDFRSISELSIRSNTPVCYVVSDGESSRLQAMYGFYVDKRLQRPDLEPRLVDTPFKELDSSMRTCTLWSAVHVPGFTFQNEHRYDHCQPRNTETGAAVNIALACPAADAAAQHR